MPKYDVIVVGARCAGSPTAMLLAQRGYRVLVVDRSAFPSDTLSTLVIHPTGSGLLRRWGLLDEVIAAGTPPIDTYTLDFGPFAISGRPRPVDGHSTAYAPRRTVLDKILVDAAARAGAEVRERFSVEEVLVEDGRVTGIRGRNADGTRVTERARVVVGADGRNSMVAKAVAAPAYAQKPRLQTGYYAFWRDLPVEGFTTYIRPYRAFAAIPTNDDLTLIVGGWPQSEAAANKVDIEGNFHRMLDLVPEFADRVRRATRVSRFAGGSSPNFFRVPSGPGWALIGDAGYTKDPVTAQGISDAFRDAEAMASALDEALSGARAFDEVMGEYQAARDDGAMPIYEFTAQLASFEPPPPEFQALLEAVSRDPEATDDFLSVIAGVLSPAVFFDPENVARIMGGALSPA